MTYQQVEVTGASPASLLNSAGSACLILNDDPNNTVWIGDNNSIRASDPNGVVPLPASSSIVVDGSTDTYGICSSGQSALVLVVPGGLNFFLPVISLTLPFGKTAGQRIVLDGQHGAILLYNAAGKIIASIANANGTDANGNNWVGPGFVSYDGTGAWAELNAASLLFQTNDFSQLIPQGITYQVIGAGAGRQIAIRLKSPTYVAGQDATLFLESASADSGITSGATIIGSLGQGGSFQLGLDNTGNPEFILGTNTPAKATDPATGNAETWHAISLATGLSGTLQCQLLPFNAVMIDAELTYATVAADTTFTNGSMPSASYYPPRSRRPPGTATGNPTTDTAPRLFVPSGSGGIQVIVPNGSSGFSCTAIVPTK